MTVGANIISIITESLYDKPVVVLGNMFKIRLMLSLKVGRYWKIAQLIFVLRQGIKM